MDTWKCKSVVFVMWPMLCKVCKHWVHTDWYLFHLFSTVPPPSTHTHTSHTHITHTHIHTHNTHHMHLLVWTPQSTLFSSKQRRVPG